MFGVGVGLLLLTFALTVQVFSRVDDSLLGKGPYLPNPGIQAERLADPGQNGEAEDVSPLMQMVLVIGLKFLGLFVMGYVASLVATKGIQFAYAPAAALRPVEELRGR